ncbi:MAG: cyclopropane-fatty-acyl-phospholipid synthase family protein [Betaproteobacteria bacterium]
MNTIATTARAPSARIPAAGRLLTALLHRLDIGSVELTTPEGAMLRFGPGGAPAEGSKASPAVLSFRDWRIAGEALKGGDVAFAESYMEGRWDTPDLTQLLTVLAANQSALEHAFYGRWWARSLLRLKHLLNANTKRQSRKNILAHYDLGNDFYSLWLDPGMTYSSALFDGHFAMDFTAAQQAKYSRLLGELELPAQSRVLEIGCGWGGFAETAARAGHHVTGISLSDAQTRHAQQRLAHAGLGDHARMRIEDYRDVQGTFDGIASIEMFEAVGERYWPAYFRTIRDALRPGGRACIQTITIADDRFERYRTQSDFIQQYIFPGGMLASPARFVDVALASGLVLERVHTFGRDYAETLKRWLVAFDEHTPAIRAQGFEERFIRCWRFYLAYCAAGFDTGTTDVGQYTFVRA